MTLDEAIQHYDDIIRDKQFELAMIYRPNRIIKISEVNKYKKCIEEYEQLKKWLEELKTLRKEKIRI